LVFGQPGGGLDLFLLGLGLQDGLLDGEQELVHQRKERRRELLLRHLWEEGGDRGQGASGGREEGDKKW